MRRVKINFMNNEYFIKTDADDQYVERIVQYIEEKVKEISKREGPVVVPSSLLLTMFKIADDYFRLIGDFEEYKDSADKRSKRLVEILDSSLNEADSFQLGERVNRDEIGKEKWEDTFR